jgi:hypothetical protein
MEQQQSSSEVQQQGNQGGRGGGEGGKFYVFFVDDREFRVDTPVITGAAIMQLAGIPVEVGINLIEEDGTQRPVKPTDEIELKPGRRFKKAPRFKRG